MKKLTALASGITGATVLAFPLVAQAQQIVTPNTGNSVLDQLQRFLTPITNVGPITAGGLFTAILNLLVLVAAIIAFVYLIWAGIRYITAGTDEEAAKKAKAAVYNAIIGIVIIIIAYVIIANYMSAQFLPCTQVTATPSFDSSLFNSAGGLFPGLGN